MNIDGIPSLPCKKCGTEKLQVAGQRGGLQWFDCENGCYASGPEIQPPIPQPKEPAMTEREMLELAAKAYGKSCEFWDDAEERYIDGPGFMQEYGDIWNPGREDGDCARMEAALDIEVNWFEYECSASVRDESPECTEKYSNHTDKNAARRMASLKVAAAIGKAMT